MYKRISRVYENIHTLDISMCAYLYSYVCVIGNVYEGDMCGKFKL
jgi:hypothetical protein